MQSKTKHIVIAPLNWGLGHATRCIPLIRKYKNQGHIITIASDGAALKLLQIEFPELDFLELPSFHIQYPKKNHFFKMFSYIPYLITSILKDYFFLKKWLQNKFVDMIISDHKLGIFSSHIKSIVICHQVQFQIPFGKKIINYIHTKLLQNFDECWIPDTKTHTFAGKLSTPLKNLKNIRYIGVLSRFKKYENIVKNIDVLVIASGPEPYRSSFIHDIFTFLDLRNKKIVLICGDYTQTKVIKNENVTIHNHVESLQMEYLINHSNLVISRAGYTSIMDYVVLEVNAIVIPTPFQYEQIYLTKLHKKNQNFKNIKLKHLMIFKSLFHLNPIFFSYKNHKNTVNSTSI